MMITRWNRGMPTPFDALMDVRRELDRVFSEAAASNGDATWSGLHTDVVENADELRVTLEMPGVRPEDVELTIDNNVLTIAGEKRREQNEGSSEDGPRITERRYGRFQRSFVLPQNVDPERISAESEHGVLTVRLPKKEEARPRRIEVRPGSGRQLTEG